MTDNQMTDPAMPSGSLDDLPLAAARDATPRPAVIDAWAKLDQTDRLLTGGTIATAVVTILGIPFGAWASTDFILILLVATAVAGVAVWLGRPSNVGSVSAPLPLIELAAASVVAVLVVWNAIEIAFDIGSATRGGIVGIVLTAALAVAGSAILAGAFRRVDGARALLASGDLWTRLAEVGLALVLVGWALNLSIGYWTMAAATLTLAVLTLAAVLILLSSRIPSPIPVAWAGVVLGVFAAWLAIGLWSELATLGEQTVDLSITDILSFLVYVVGLGLIVAGGVLTALEQGAKQPATAAEPPTTIG